MVGLQRPQPVVLTDEDGDAYNRTSPIPVGAKETTVTPAAVTLVALTAKDLKAASATRIRLTIYNPLATTLFVRKATLVASAATVSAGGYDFVVPPGSTWVSDPYEWAGGYNGICATAGDVGVSESV